MENKNKILIISLGIILVALISYFYIFNSDDSLSDVENFKLFISENSDLIFDDEIIEGNYIQLNYKNVYNEISYFKFININYYNYKNIYGFAMYENENSIISDLNGEYNYFFLKNFKYNFLEVKSIENESFRINIENYILENFEEDSNIKDIVLKDKVENDVLNNTFNKNIGEFNLFKFGRLDNKEEIIYNYEYYSDNKFFLLYISNLDEIEFDKDSYINYDLGKFNNFKYNILFFKNISKDKQVEIINRFNELYDFK